MILFFLHLSLNDDEIFLIWANKLGLVQILGKGLAIDNKDTPFIIRILTNLIHVDSNDEKLLSEHKTLLIVKVSLLRDLFKEKIIMKAVFK